MTQGWFQTKDDARFTTLWSTFTWSQSWSLRVAELHKLHAALTGSGCRVGCVPIVQQEWGKWIVKLWCETPVNKYGCNSWTFWRCNSIFKGKILAMLAYWRVNLSVILFPRGQEATSFWTKLPKNSIFLRRQNSFSVTRKSPSLSFRSYFSIYLYLVPQRVRIYIYIYISSHRFSSAKTTWSRPLGTKTRHHESILKENPQPVLHINWWCDFLKNVVMLCHACECEFFEILCRLYR